MPNPKNSQSLSLIDEPRIESLYQRAASHIDTARQQVLYTVNNEMIKAYWHIGQDIIQEEQSGVARAEYGKALLKGLSQKLQVKYRSGFSVDSLEKARKFYLLYPDLFQKSATLSRKSLADDLLPNLSWSHYIELMKVLRPEARYFYAREANKNHWKVRELRRQIDSFLFDRLAKSKDQQAILALAEQGQELLTPADAMKDPLILEFLGAPEPHQLSESKFETALINNIQAFLLELGRGFAFVARQKRLTLDGRHFYCDLVFYHYVLKCFVIADIKTHELEHGDLGQMQLYVNYFDQEIKMDNDNPTVGLILCTEKSDKMVKYLLGDKAKQIFVSRYQFHLPTEVELEIELKKEIEELKSGNPENTLNLPQDENHG